MHMLGGILGGAVGGLLGAAIWAAVAFWGRYELGWIAWGIGGLVGMGVYLGGRRRGGITAGGTAVALAVAAVLLGKWGAACADVSAWMHGDEQPIGTIADVLIAEREESGRPQQMSREDPGDTDDNGYPPGIWSEAQRRWETLTPQQQEELRELPMLANPQFFQVYLADDVVDEYAQQGRSVEWPPGMDRDSAWRQPHYPADVWAEAASRWEAMSPQQRDEYAAKVQDELRAGQVMWARLNESKLVSEAFLASFAPYDLLWIGLAVVTSWRLGAAGLARPAPAAQDPTAPGQDAAA